MLNLADINFGKLQKHLDDFYCLGNIRILFHSLLKQEFSSSSVQTFERELY
jgi:hypothetical protein